MEENTYIKSSNLSKLGGTTYAMKIRNLMQNDSEESEIWDADQWR